MPAKLWVVFPQSSDSTPSKGKIARINVREADGNGTKVKSTACKNAVVKVSFYLRIMGIEFP
jgi:hypothetical protein